MARQYIAPYSAAPDLDDFAPLDADELDLLRQAAAAMPATADGTWERDLADTLDRDLELVDAALTSGQAVLLARDEDGYYFAVEAN